MGYTRRVTKSQTTLMDNKLEEGILNRDFALFATLLEAGENPHAETEDGTLLHTLYTMEAPPATLVAVTRLLLGKGLDVNAASPDEGRTPLMLAVLHDNLPLVRLLLEYGADVSPADTEEGATALHFAAERACPECVGLLLQHGADVDARETDGMTPLMWAVWSKRPQVVGMLLQHGADVHAQNEYGNTALSMAMAIQTAEQARHITTLLRNHGA